VSEPAFAIGVDGGQTATRALVARFDARPLGEGSGGPLVHFRSEGGLAQNRAAIQTAILAACTAANVPRSSVRSVALGLTGVQLDAPEAPTVEAIVREVLSAQTVLVVPDYVTNLAGAALGESGVVVIAGGGSVVYGVAADGREALVGGYGYLVGDEGSGFDIGRHAVMAAIRASEDRGSKTTLEAAVRTHFQVSHVRELFNLVYDASFSRERLSQVTPLVAREAEHGDSVARAIMRRAGRELANSCLAAIRTLFTPGERPNIYLSGGVWQAGDVIREPFLRRLTRCWGAVDIRTPRASPVEGALVLASRPR
jgi:N-acetylglucosamine kinase